MHLKHWPATRRSPKEEMAAYFLVVQLVLRDDWCHLRTVWLQCARVHMDMTVLKVCHTHTLLLSKHCTREPFFLLSRHKPQQRASIILAHDTKGGYSLTTRFRGKRPGCDLRSLPAVEANERTSTVRGEHRATAVAAALSGD
ncbi:hypothetical protein EXIGLDRAFT_61252 [Exidia glandulosa HHB12029]|uniref:Uncharacterized protein n=1 Tax=Exidia glandulosa HHB12029 TaxID=1314781 RepID=A0A165I3V6_EXIGL|nr:hypothetical protein EXIGLDRAFT_61252 [Exidia glandulosa HHB12029]